MARASAIQQRSISKGTLSWQLILGLIVSSLLLAIFFGLVAVTANLIFVAVSVAMIVGTLLLAKPAWNIWVILTMGLLVAGVLPIWLDFIATKAVWALSILGFMLLGSALFRLVAVPGVSRNTPAFIWVALLFLVYALIESFAQWQSGGQFLSGTKRYFQMWGLLFALCWLSIDELSVRRWRGFFLLVALVQLPFAVYELIDLVPMRERYVTSIPGLVPIDVVAGTFGSYRLQGGANAEMATFLIIVLAFLLAGKKENTLSPTRLFWLVPFVMAPLFLGETKVVVILLPMMFFVLYRRELIARPHYAVIALMVGALFTVTAGYVYLGQSKKSADQQVVDMLRYNIYEQGYGTLKLNRTTVLTYWAEQQGVHDPVSFMFGNGIGSASDSGLSQGHIAKRHPSYGIGLTAASTMLWETGVVGFGLILLMLVLAWRLAGRLLQQVGAAGVRADLAAIQAFIAIYTFSLFYRSSALDILGYQIVFASILGYLAWLYRRYGSEHAPA